MTRVSLKYFIIDAIKNSEKKESKNSTSPRIRNK
jgi:hypothetical protein